MLTLQRARLIVAALWAWPAIMVAIAAATLSAYITDRAAFGAAVSYLFRIEALVGLVCSLVLLVFLWSDTQLGNAKRRNQSIMAAVGLACILGYFALQPVMAGLREGAGPAGVMASAARKQFGMLHGVSMLLYLVQTVMAVVLVVKNRK
ncbi:MAG: DUF4149 domain-containing protein [Pseudomonadota bacterium]